MSLYCGHVMDCTQTKFGDADNPVGEVGYFEHQRLAALSYSPGRLVAKWETSDASPAPSNPDF